MIQREKRGDVWRKECWERRQGNRERTLNTVWSAVNSEWCCFRPSSSADNCQPSRWKQMVGMSQDQKGRDATRAQHMERHIHYLPTVLAQYTASPCSSFLCPNCYIFIWNTSFFTKAVVTTKCQLISAIMTSSIQVNYILNEGRSGCMTCI